MRPFLLATIFMRRLVLTLAAVFCSTLVFAQAFASFDAPGAGTGVYQGTFPVSVNDKGGIAGYYADNSNIRHGFLRKPDGEFTTFTPPNLSGILVVAMNNGGQILGTGTLPNPYSNVAFLRHPAGYFAVFSPASASNTTPCSLNNTGEVTGYFQDAAYVYHGFLRTSDGNITVIDDPEVALSDGKGTFACAINDRGEIAGYYNDQRTGGVRAFIRDETGHFINFDAIVGGSAGLHISAINSAGEVVGQFWNTSLDTQGFLRDSSGTITDFAVTGTNLTVTTGINDSGTVVGLWDDSQLYRQGFQRDTAGNITTFSAPDFNYGTVFAGINNHGTITGYCTDLNYISHGFVFRQPSAGGKTSGR